MRGYELIPSNVNQRPDTYPLPTTIEGFRLLLDGEPLPLLVVSGYQIIAQVPFNVTHGIHQLVAQTPSGDSPPYRLNILLSSPGLFHFNYEAEALHQNMERVRADFGMMAAPGEPFQLYGTGLGAVTNVPAPGMPAPADPLSHAITPLRVLFNGIEGEVSFAGLAPGYVGLYQINVTVPDEVTGTVEVVAVQENRASMPVFINVAGKHEVASYYLGGFYNRYTDRSSRFQLTRTDSNGEEGPFEFSWEMGSLAEKYLDWGTLKVEYTGEVPRFRATFTSRKLGEPIPMAMETFDGGHEWVGVGGSESFTLLWTNYRFIIRATRPMPVQLVPPFWATPPSECAQVQGAEIWSPDGMFLGVVNNNVNDRNSIANRFGPYGGGFSPTSIRNAESVYGYRYGGNQSVFSTDSTSPPVLLVNGSPVAFVTMNTQLRPRVSPILLTSCSAKP